MKQLLLICTLLGYVTGYAQTFNDEVKKAYSPVWELKVARNQEGAEKDKNAYSFPPLLGYALNPNDISKFTGYKVIAQGTGDSVRCKYDRHMNMVETKEWHHGKESTRNKVDTDDYDHPISNTAYRWNSEKSKWETTEIAHYEFDSLKHFMTLSVTRGDFYPYYGIRIGFDEFGNDTGSIELGESYGYEGLVNRYRHSYTYDVDGRQVTDTWYDWDVKGNTWLLALVEKNMYDSSGNKIMTSRNGVVPYKKGEFSDFRYSEKIRNRIHYTYDSRHRITSRIDSAYTRYHDGTENWSNEIFYSDTDRWVYDTIGNMHRTTEHSYYPTFSVYDALNNLIVFRNGRTGEKDTMIYDTKGNILHILHHGGLVGNADVFFFYDNPEEMALLDKARDVKRLLLLMLCSLVVVAAFTVYRHRQI